MKSSIADLPVTYDLPLGMSQTVDWGNMTVTVVKVRQTADPSQLNKGLPDDRCQCPHWGYVLKGRHRIKFADHEEVYEEGDLYYAPPGHTPLLEEGAEYIEFSPTDEVSKTNAVVGRNLQAMQ